MPPSKPCRRAARAVCAGPRIGTIAGVPEWPDVSDEVFYHLMPAAWRADEGDAAPGRWGTFRGLTAGLPYLRRLGVTAIITTPIFEGPSYHGYQHGPADRVHPRLGTEAAYRAFVRAAHDAGLRVVIDMVTYGLWRASPPFRAARARPTDPHSSWFAFDDDRACEHTGYDYAAWDGSRVEFAHLDLRRPGPRRALLEWARRWLTPSAAGGDAADGLRFDHVWATDDGKHPSVTGLGYTGGGFWAWFLGELRASHPRALMLAEPARWETLGNDLLPWHDAAFCKPLEFAVRDAVCKERSAGLSWALRRALRAVPAGQGLVALVGDHDVDRLASAVGAETAADLCRLRSAFAVLMLQPFPPVIYAGDEIGMLGVAGEFGGDANDIPRREPFKWRARAGPPMSDYHSAHAGAWEARWSRDDDGRSVEEQEGVPGSPLEVVRRLVQMRRGSDAIRRGGFEPVRTDAPSVWACRRRLGDQWLLAAVNLSDRPATARLRRPAPGDPAGLELGPWGVEVVRRGASAPVIRLS